MGSRSPPIHLKVIALPRHFQFPRGPLPAALGRYGGLAAGVVALLWSGVPLCPSAGWFGLPCPGCGLTRATLALVSGSPAAALRIHPLVFVVLPALAGIVGAALLRASKGRLSKEAPRHRTWGRWANRGGLCLIVALLVVWGLRFMGHFGGPAEVTTYAQWWQSLRS